MVPCEYMYICNVYKLYVQVEHSRPSRTLVFSYEAIYNDSELRRLLINQIIVRRNRSGIVPSFVPVYAS